jgi:hypothetical protein
LGILMPETRDGAQGLPKKPAPVRSPPPPRTGTLTAIMEIENLTPYAPFAVGLKPPAMQGEARRRGL